MVDSQTLDANSSYTMKYNNINVSSPITTEVNIDQINVSG